MKAPRSAALALATLLICTGAASADGRRVWVPGGANTSCATWSASPEQYEFGSVWVLGFWGGLNLKNPKGEAVGASTDSAGIIGEAKLACEAKPSIDLLAATLTVYDRLEKAGG